MRESVTIPYLFTGLSLTPHYRRIESLNASPCHAYSVAHQSLFVKSFGNIHGIFTNKIFPVVLLLLQTQFERLFIVLVVISAFHLTLFLEHMQCDQRSDCQYHTADKDDKMGNRNAGYRT